MTLIFHKLIQLMMMCHHKKFSCKEISNLEDIYSKNHILIYNNSLWLWQNKQIFWKTLWLMMMHHHTKFGGKRFSGSEDISGQTFIDILNFRCDLDLEDSTPIFSTTSWLMMMHHHTKFGNKMFGSLEGIIWTNIHWHSESSLWPWPYMQYSIFFHRTLLLMMLYYQSKFGCKPISSLGNSLETV